MLTVFSNQNTKIAAPRVLELAAYRLSLFEAAPMKDTAEGGLT